jgi:transcriptional regulator with XRE-family HTH domain
MFGMFIFSKKMGEKLAIIRKKSKLSQKEVAIRMGI